jgi:hypothetical protein
MLHKVAWTSSSELYEELGIEMKEIKANHWKELTAESRKAFEAAAQSIRNVWPRFKV